MKRVTVLVLFVAAFITACSDKKTSPLTERVSSFLSEHENTITFGSVDLDALLNKSDLESFPNFGNVIMEQYKSLKSSFTLTDKIYFALDGPVSRDGVPSRSYFFMHVENKDSLSDLFEDMGYFFEEESGFHIAEDNNMAIGYDEDLFIAFVGRNDDNVRDLLKSAFAATQSGDKNDKALDMLAREGDFIIASNLKELYGTSNTDLNKLPIKQQEEVRAMADGSYIASSLNFKDGEIVFESENYFNDKLKETLFFNEKMSFNPLEKLGPGDAILAFAFDLDIVKLESLVDRFYPAGLNELYKSMGTSGLILKGLGGEELSKIVDGRFGLAMSSIPENTMGAEVPELAMYMGIGSSGDKIVEVINDFTSGPEIEEVEKGKGVYRFEDARIKMDEGEMTVHSTIKNYASEDFSKKLTIHSDEVNFGSKPMSLFIDINRLVKEDIGREFKDARVLLSTMNYLYLEADNASTQLRITFKNKEINALKALLDALQSELQNIMSNV